MAEPEAVARPVEVVELAVDPDVLARADPVAAVPVLLDELDAASSVPLDAAEPVPEVPLVPDELPELRRPEEFEDEVVPAERPPDDPVAPVDAPADVEVEEDEPEGDEDEDDEEDHTSWEGSPLVRLTT